MRSVQAAISQELHPSRAPWAEEPLRLTVMTITGRHSDRDIRRRIQEEMVERAVNR